MKKTLASLVKGKKIIAVICDQWGDTGKGKISDYLSANWADVIARGTGGNNAGHTIIINDKKKVFHFLPAGIIYDKLGKITVLGNGMVLNLPSLFEELDELEKEGYSYKNLMISENAHVIMPYHIEFDKQKNTDQKKGGVGSTGRGIGPCYTDKIARRGIIIKDLFDKKILKKKIETAKEFYPNLDINYEKIIKELSPYIRKIKPLVKNTIAQMAEFRMQEKKILLEGAQGLLLSIEFGTFPFVTSSDCSLNGTASGVGIPASEIDLPLGIVKFPYMTRVGAGPFPTESGGKKSDKYCASGLDNDIFFELKKYKIPFEVVDGDAKYDHSHENIVKLMNSEDEFLQGIGLRLAGEEYGATTKRPRRCGITDLEALKYAVGINGAQVILTKADVAKNWTKIRLGYGYDFKMDAEHLKKVKVKYKNFSGFKEDISEIRDFDKLPKGLKESILFLEKYTGAKVCGISVGAKQDQMIIR